MKGGISPKKLKNTSYKYTLNKNRQHYIDTLYQYAPILLECVVDIPWNTYKYKGICSILYTQDNDITLFSTKKETKPEETKPKETNPIIYREQSCKTIGSPTYYFFGGCVYELLNQDFPSLDLHSYVDKTGDIDIKIYPPRIDTDYNAVESHSGALPFFDENGEIQPFYVDFIHWIKTQLVEKVKKYQTLFDKIVSPFDIDDYTEIEHDSLVNGYFDERVGHLHIVGFLDGAESMYKIQIVVKTIDINHILEMVLITGKPIDAEYSLDEYNKIGKYNIQPYHRLIRDNVSAYIERKQNIQEKGTTSYIEKYQHKTINHVARLLYLYEYCYKKIQILDKKSKEYKDIFQTNFNIIGTTTLPNDIPVLIYYKNDKKISIPTKDFLNAYFSVLISLKLKGSLLTAFNKKHNNYFDQSVSHDEFIERFFNGYYVVNKKKSKSKSKSPSPKNKTVKRPSK